MRRFLVGFLLLGLLGACTSPPSPGNSLLGDSIGFVDLENGKEYALPLTVKVRVSGDIDRVELQGQKDGAGWSLPLRYQGGLFVGEIKEEGEYGLQAVGYKENAEKVKTPLVAISLLRPQVEILEPSDKAVLRDSVTVLVHATDNVGVKEVELFSGETSLGRLTSGVNGEYKFRVDTTRLADGPHTLRAVAKDQSGNTGESQVAVVVDNKGPVVRWISPVDGQRVEGVVTLHVEVQDEGDAQPQVEYQVNGQKVVDADANQPGVQWNTGVLEDGEYELRAIAKDQAGNRGENGLRVKVDNDPPQIEWLAPSEGAALMGKETLVVRVEDFPGVKEVYFLADVGGQTRFLGSAQDKGDGRWELVWDTGTFPNGQVTLDAVARNLGGRQSVSPRTVNVANPDTEPPSVVWVDPVADQNVSGEVPLRVRALDNQGIKEVRFFAGGQALGEGSLQDSTYTLSWNTRAFPDGPVSLRVVVRDTSDNPSTAEIQVQVRNAGMPPRLSILQPEEGKEVGVQFTVRVSVAKQGSGFTWVHALWARVYDYRGHPVAERPLLSNGQEPPDDQDSVSEAFFDLGRVPADQYRLVVEGEVEVNGVQYRLHQEIPIQVKVSSNQPPALVLYSPSSEAVAPGGNLSLVGKVTDDSGKVHALEVRLIRGGCKNPSHENYLMYYEAEPYGLFSFSVPLDAYPYIADGSYCLRVVAIDADDLLLRNIQELDVRVDRGYSPPSATIRVTDPNPPTVTVPGHAAWEVSFATPVRYTLLLRKDGKPVEVYTGTGNTYQFERSFSDNDTGTWDVVVVFEDENKVQGMAQGGSVAVVGQ